MQSMTSIRPSEASAVVQAPSDTVQLKTRSLSRVESWPLFWTAVLLAITLVGAGYYFVDLSVRARHPWHDWLRPSGIVGQTVGIATFLGFLFMWLYPLRKKLGPRRSLGRIPRWLDVHIAVGLTLPALGAVHAGWRFGGIIGIGYWAMIIVVLSGVAGRYLYTRVPRSRSGVELSVEQIGGEQRRLLLEIATLMELQPEEVRSILTSSSAGAQPLGILGTIVRLIRDDFRRHRIVRELRKRAKEKGIEMKRLDAKTMRRIRALSLQQISLGQQLRVLEHTQRVLRLWHVAHRPVAVTAFLAVATHVLVVLLFGATWFY